MIPIDEPVVEIEVAAEVEAAAEDSYSEGSEDNSVESRRVDEYETLVEEFEKCNASLNEIIEYERYIESLCVHGESDGDESLGLDSLFSQDSSNSDDSTSTSSGLFQSYVEVSVDEISPSSTPLMFSHNEPAKSSLPMRKAAVQLEEESMFSPIVQCR